MLLSTYQVILRAGQYLIFQVLRIIKIIMSVKQFLQQGKWINSFALFGRGQIVYHNPITTQNTSSRIQRIPFNPSYSKQIKLAQSLSKQLYSLIKQLNLKPSNPLEVKINHLRNMMYCVVIDAGSETQPYHNIIYLTIKYLGCVATQQAKQRSFKMQDQMEFKSLLGDIYRIYYQIHPQMAVQSLSQEQQLLKLFKVGKYEEMIGLVRDMYCRTDEKNVILTTQLSVLISLLLLKNAEETEQQPFSPNNSKRKKFIDELRKKFNGVTQMKLVKDKPSTIQLMGQTLLGKESSLQILAENSWPLFLINHTDFFQMGNQEKRKELKLKTSKFIKSSKNYNRISFAQTEYLFSLFFQPNIHTMYQSLFGLVPSFYCHFMAYLFDLISPNPIPNLLVQDYFTEIIRNLLYHASQISFQSLIYCIGAVQQAFNQRKSDIYQPLLFHHLVVIDPQDKQQLKQFLQRVNFLKRFQLQTYAISQLNTLIQKLLESGIISRQLLIIYANCCIILKSYYTYDYNYHELLAYHLQEIYSSTNFTLEFLDEYQQLKDELQETDHKMKSEIVKLKPLLEKFYLFKRILSEEQSRKKNYNYITYLMQKTYRSLRLLQLIADRVQVISTSQSQNQEPNSEISTFLASVKLFVGHYPGECSEEEKVLVKKIQCVIG